MCDDKLSVHDVKDAVKFGSGFLHPDRTVSLRRIN
jgi:hypothetical protein